MAPEPLSRRVAPGLAAELAAELVAVADALADAARAAALPHFRIAIAAENKAEGCFDPVTAADRAVERAMRDILAVRRPDDGILGEEYGTTEGASGLTWVLDPIDGTRAFLAGTPTWGCLIAVADADGPLHGVIEQPYTGERWSGGLSPAAFAGPHGARPLATRPPRPLAEAILFSTFPEIGTAAELAAFARVAGRARLTRYGLDCYAYGLLALGQIDLVIEAGLAPYDICAPAAVVQAAGGVVTTWDGGPPGQGGRILAAASPRIHAEAMALLAP